MWGLPSLPGLPLPSWCMRQWFDFHQCSMSPKMAHECTEVSQYLKCWGEMSKRKNSTAHRRITETEKHITISYCKRKGELEDVNICKDSTLNEWKYQPCSAEYEIHNEICKKRFAWGRQFKRGTTYNHFLGPNTCSHCCYISSSYQYHQWGQETLKYAFATKCHNHQAQG